MRPNINLPSYIAPVPLDKFYRLMNHGPKVLMSARHEGVDNMMSAVWADDRVFRQGRCHLDQAPDHLRTLHHVAGGQFIAAGPTIQE